MSLNLMGISKMQSSAAAISMGLVSALKKLNETYPEAKLSMEQREQFIRNCPSGLPGPEPENMTGMFELLGFLYLSQSNVPVPDEYFDGDI